MAKCIHLGSISIIGGEAFCRLCGDVDEVDLDPFDKHHPYKYAEIA